MNIEQLIAKVKKQKTNFIIVTGGVCSSIGKGVLTSSMGVLVKKFGASVSVIKLDPYLNIDPGTMSPLVHGEVFVTHDGAETDLDLGHYERMIGVELTKNSSVSSGQAFQEILDAERTGKFLGKCIQLVPHVVDAIKVRILQLALNTKAEFILAEIGGTVGDIEGEVFLEAIRQLRMNLTSKRMLHCHLSFVPYLNWANEVKTKPTQHSVMLLKRAGLVPDSIFLRTDQIIPEESLQKVSVMCGVRKDLIFQALTYNPIYTLFIDLNKQCLATKIQEWFSIKPKKKINLSDWESLIKLIKKPKETINIGLVVKYFDTNEPYISVIEAIKAAGYGCKRDVKIVTIDATALEKKDSTKTKQKALKQLESVSGIVVPGGFGKRGTQGKIIAAQWARENNVPYFGLCLGMQLMLIEFAQNVVKLKEASSTEFNSKTPHPIIVLLDEQHNIVKKGGTMRLGAFKCSLKKDSKAQKAYCKNNVCERHRHRYEFNNTYKKQLEEAGIVFSGINTERDLIEIAELRDHPFMVGTQFHPEFLSSPLQPHPLFLNFIEAAIEYISKTSK